MNIGKEINSRTVKQMYTKGGKTSCFDQKALVKLKEQYDKQETKRREKVVKHKGVLAWIGERIKMARALNHKTINLDISQCFMRVCPYAD
jgi:hypothetical protein